MKSPKTVKEVQCLTGSIAALSRFISKSADRCLMLFRVLKRENFKWDEEAKEAFLDLKKYLAEIPKLVSPLPGELLFLCVSISDYSISAILIVERE